MRAGEIARVVDVAVFLGLDPRWPRSQLGEPSPGGVRRPLASTTRSPVITPPASVRTPAT